MITFKQKGDFSKLDKYLKKSKNISKLDIFDYYGKLGTESLVNLTPTDTGKTASEWSYKITKSKNRVKISFYNGNIQNGVPIAIILQYGHYSKNGGWIEGRDYINPAIAPVFDKMAKELWKEVIRNE